MPQMPGQVLKNPPVSLAGSSIQEQGAPLKSLLKRITCMKATRERGYFEILPLDGVRSYRPISLARRQIVDSINMKERSVTFGNQVYVQ